MPAFPSQAQCSPRSWFIKVATHTATTLVKTNRESVRPPPFNTELLIGARLRLVRAAPDFQFGLVEREFSGEGK
jgi:hypothetical protein